MTEKNLKSAFDALYTELEILEDEMRWKAGRITDLLFYAKGKIRRERSITDGMEGELKPCPFCGSDEVQMYSPMDGSYKVICFCGASGAESHDWEKAAAYWNRRGIDE